MIHAVLDLTACTHPHPEPAALVAAMRATADVLGTTVRAELVEPFHPHGITAVLILAESHLAVTTWPEYALAHLDVFTCRADAAPEEAVAPIVVLLGGHIARTARVPRLFPATQPSLGRDAS